MNRGKQIKQKIFIIIGLLILCVFLFQVKSASAYTFPAVPTIPPFPTYAPCFPFCTTATVTPTSTPKPTPTPTVQVTPSLTPAPSTTATSSGQLYWGAYVGSQPIDLSGITSFENDAGKGMSFVLWYQSFGVTDGTQNFEQPWMDTVRNHGSIPFVTLEPWNYTRGTNQPTYRLINIINGNFDTYLRKWATDAKAWGHPFLLRFAHEMNGNWYSWDEGVNQNKAGQYVKAWKHVHDIFTSVGANNVSWVWCPNVVYSGSTALSELYPGDNYVDWLCVDGYNWGNTNGGWQSFSTLFTPTYTSLTSLSSKPLMIGETSSAEVGGSKAQWITDALGGGIDALTNIKAVVWFNQNNPPDWRIESSSTAQNAFRGAIADPKYMDNSFNTIDSILIP